MQKEEGRCGSSGSASFTRVNPRVQTPVPPKTKQENRREREYTNTNNLYMLKL
jgi:hypothetical protein